MNVRRLLTGRSSAERDYFHGDKQLGGIWDALAVEVDPAARAGLLWRAADTFEDMADAFPHAFGPDPIPHEEGRDMTESLESSGGLALALAQVELVLAGHREHRILPGGADDPRLGSDAWAVLDEMAETPDLGDRMRLLERLYEAVEPRVGGQAAEILACLPAPGWRGWEREDPQDRLPATVSVRSFLRAVRVAWRTRKAVTR